MKLHRLVLVVALTTVAGPAWGQQPPAFPNAYPPDLARLQGTWKVTLTDGDAKDSRWQFVHNDHVSVVDGGKMISLPFKVKEGLLVLQIPGQKWTGRYTFVDNDTLFLRLPKLGPDASGHTTMVLERVSGPAVPVVEKKAER